MAYNGLHKGRHPKKWNNVPNKGGLNGNPWGGRFLMFLNWKDISDPILKRKKEIIYFGPFQCIYGTVHYKTDILSEFFLKTT